MHYFREDSVHDSAINKFHYTTVLYEKIHFKSRANPLCIDTRNESHQI